MGYNDTYLLLGLTFSGIRSLGLDALIAQELSHIIFRIIGFLCTWIFFRRYLSGSVFSAAFAATLTVVLHSAAYAVSNTQLSLVGLTPFELILLAELLRSAEEGALLKGILIGGGIGLLFGSWLMTAFYMAWFTGVFIIVGVIALALFDRRLLASTTAKFCTNRMWLTPIAAVLVASPFLYCFLWLYAPKLAETGGQPFSEIVRFLLPFPGGFLGLAGENWLWSDLINATIYAPSQGTFLEISGYSAFTPLMTICFVAAAISVNWWTRGLSRSLRAAIICAVIAISTLYIAQMRFGSVSPWEIIYQIVPGAAAIRVVNRISLLLALPAACVIALWLQLRVAKYSIIIAFLLGLSVILEQYSTLDMARMETGSIARFIDSIPSPPENCKSFYIIDPPAISPFWPGRVYDQDSLTWINGDVMAMIVASEINLPTINGHASYLPNGWFLKGAFGEDYRRRIADYAQTHQLSDPCELNLTERRWSWPLFRE
ncbi:hypothetical protein [Amorphus sp. 3PC139-8]|uniref:hypothetical protein n=1 Tax=Amorphus sp. 3PC139-8 TaxID=2735676 RepID=UPI00345C7E8C